MRPGVKITIGVLVALFTMSFVVVYDLYIKDKIDSVEVVVVKSGNDIEKNEPIKSSKLSIELRAKKSLIDGAITASEVGEIIGVEAAQTLVSNSMISEKMLNRDLLIPNEDKKEAIRPIKADWIYAAPGSLRRKDNIDIYVVKGSGKKTQGKVGGFKVESEVVKSETDEMAIEGPILENVKVIYAKDYSNKEVIGSDKDKRLDASSQIAELEIILDEDNFIMLMDYVIKKEYKLYITYN